MSPVPGRKIERASAGTRDAAAADKVDQPPLPSLILPVRQDDCDEIVTIGDRRKHRADVATFPIRRRDRVGRASWGFDG